MHTMMQQSQQSKSQAVQQQQQPFVYQNCSVCVDCSQIVTNFEFHRTHCRGNRKRGGAANTRRPGRFASSSSSDAQVSAPLVETRTPPVSPPSMPQDVGRTGGTSELVDLTTTDATTTAPTHTNHSTAKAKGGGMQDIVFIPMAPNLLQPPTAPNVTSSWSKPPTPLVGPVHTNHVEEETHETNHDAWLPSSSKSSTAAAAAVFPATVTPAASWSKPPPLVGTMARGLGASSSHKKKEARILTTSCLHASLDNMDSDDEFDEDAMSVDDDDNPRNISTTPAIYFQHTESSPRTHHTKLPAAALVPEPQPFVVPTTTTTTNNRLAQQPHDRPLSLDDSCASWGDHGSVLQRDKSLTIAEAVDRREDFVDLHSSDATLTWDSLTQSTRRWASGKDSMTSDVLAVHEVVNLLDDDEDDDDDESNSPRPPDHRGGTTEPSWSCLTCTLVNANASTTCEVCETPRAGHSCPPSRQTSGRVERDDRTQESSALESLAGRVRPGRLFSRSAGSARLLQEEEPRFTDRQWQAIVDRRHRPPPRHAAPRVPNRRTSIGNMTYEELLQAFGDGTEHLGANENVLQSLPTDDITDRTLAGLPVEAKQCSICLSDFCTGDTRKTLPCLHFFHQECVERWLRTNSNCPICKYRLGRDMA